jgi:3'-phosphoadenosine 5'-phosphosulfate sulfotransferase (PAPS reductase)/FAD synthetase
MDLRSYDIIAFSSSGGICTINSMITAFEECESQGVLDRIVVVHADLGRLEWSGTVDLVKQQAKYFGLDVEIEKAKEDLLEAVVAKHNRQLIAGKDQAAWMGKGNLRWCTPQAKRGPINVLYTRLVEEWRLATGLTRPCRVLEIQGIRAEEGGKSGARAKMKPFQEMVEAKSNKTVRHVDIWFPIFEMTEEECWARVEKLGLVGLTPPSYHLKGYRDGMPRSSCVFCVYADRNMLKLAALHNRELLNDFCAVEAYTGYDFQPGLSLTELRDEIDSGLIEIEQAPAMSASY